MVPASLVCEIGGPRPGQAARDYLRGEYLRAVDDAPEIDAEDALPVLVRAEHLASWLDAGIVHQDVSAASAGGV